MKKKLSSLILLGCVLASGTASAAADPSLATSQECTRHLPTMERLYNIPAHWLGAIASTESGRYSPQLRLSVPWPWTINVAGQGYWFDTKQEALKAVQYHQSKGVKSIDVGCMQVNLMYHGSNFANISQAFEPIYNIAYAAKFLRSHYNKTNSWTKATAAYHSMQSSRGADYYRKVYQKWQQVVDRLNDSMFASAPIQQSLRSAPQPERPSSFAFREQAALPTAPAAPPTPYKVTAPQDRVRLNSITVSRGNFPPPQPQAPVAVASNNRTYDRMQAALPPAQALTPLDVLPQYTNPSRPQQEPSNMIAIPAKPAESAKREEDSPPSRKYERGVLVIRPNQPTKATEENQPVKLQTNNTETAAEVPVNRGQFAPQAIEGGGQSDGGYVTDRPQPKTVSPKFVF